MSFIQSVHYRRFYCTCCAGILIPSACVNDLKQTLTKIAEQAAGLDPGEEDSTTNHPPPPPQEPTPPPQTTTS